MARRQAGRVLRGGTTACRGGSLVRARQKAREGGQQARARPPSQNCACGGEGKRVCMPLRLEVSCVFRVLQARSLEPRFRPWQERKGCWEECQVLASCI